MLIPLFQQLFGHKAWADEELFSCMRQIPDVNDGDGRIALRLYNHIYVVDRIFEAHLQGKNHGYATTNTPETPTVANLADAVSALDTWFLSFIANQTDEDLAQDIDFIFTDGEAGKMSRAEMLQHIAIHSSYHRGEIGRILKKMEIVVPSDIFTRYLHR